MEHATTQQFVETMEAQRRRVLGHAGAILLPHDELAASPENDSISRLSALLVTSLEELKVAEEELIERHATFEQRRTTLEGELRHYRDLFQLAPHALLTTDPNGAIREVNEAASLLLRHSEQELFRRPLVSFVRIDQRTEFRTSLNRLRLTGGASDWHIQLAPRGQVPMCAVATVRVVPDTRFGEGLIWELRPVTA